MYFVKRTVRSAFPVDTNCSVTEPIRVKWPCGENTSRSPKGDYATHKTSVCVVHLMRC